MKFALDKVAIAIVVLAPVIACATSSIGGEVPIGSDCASGFCADSGPPSFIPAADGGDVAEASRFTPLLACVGTKCPAPYATCMDSPDLCETNLQNDHENCGACGNSCGNFDKVHMDSRCVKGACTFECIPMTDPIGYTLYFRNCNNLIDDGCEVNISVDEANCGACGNVCPAGVHCIRGRCGCPDGLTECNGQCVDTRVNDNHCGACNNQCLPQPTACDPKRPNTDYGCGDSVCGKVTCAEGYADCNQDLDKAYRAEGCSGDGCETDLRTDPNNCGACGRKCLPGQECRDDGNGSGPLCLDPCEKTGLARCHFPTHCSDLLNSMSDCGLCGHACPNPHDHQVASCVKGFCQMECVAGFADCNNDPSDGCEIDLSMNEANCGSCGHACDADAGAGSDGGAGQPCIEGKCLMVECDAGGPPQ
jgi:hypothetical protein